MDEQHRGFQPRTPSLVGNPSESILTSSSSHPGKQFSSPWTVTQKTLKRENKVWNFSTINNGRLKIRVIPTRGMGILDVTMDGIRLGWDSPVKEVVHPSHIDLESRGGLGWLEGFNEWMVRCGLEFASHPGTDQFLNNTGDPSTLNLTLHGKIQNIPASNYEVVVDPEPPIGSVFEEPFTRASFTGQSSNWSPKFPRLPILIPFDF